MAKKNAKVDAKLGESPETPPTDEVKQEAAAAVAKAKGVRGPRGVPEEAVVTLLSTSNPKRTGSKAEKAFSHYQNGMTVKAFADALDGDPELKGTSTGHLTYDAKHGFISIDGYDPGAIVQPKPKAEKTPKGGKVLADKPAGEGEVAAQAEAQAEKID